MTKMTLLALTLAASAATMTANAATIAVSVGVDGSPTTNNGDWAAGWEFTVDETIQVTELGKFDYEANGIVGTGVALYNRTDGGVKIAEASLVGASFELSGSYRAYYTAITPIALVTGKTYAIVAVQDGGTESIFWDNSVATYGAEINYARGIAQSGASLPVTFTSNSPQLTGTTNGYFGGTFKYVVPEPSSLALLGLGGLCVLRRRRA